MKKVIIIGAGILGASAAYELSKAGADVTVFDRQEPGQATAAAAGIICPWVSQRRNKAWYALVKAGARYYPELVESLADDGEMDTGYARTGAIMPQTDPKKLDKLEERVAARLEGAPEIGALERLDEQETAASFPVLDSSFCSIKVEGGARVDGRRLTASMLRAAARHGAAIHYADARLTYKNNRVTGVTAEGKEYPADLVLVCAGAWARQLLDPLDVRLQVSHQKAQIVHFSTDQPDSGSWPVVIPPGSQYMLAFEDGRVVAGATHEDTDDYDTRVTAGGLNRVIGHALQLAPGLENAEFAEARVGFRPYTPGFLPVIGAIPGWEGMLLANGLGSSGLTMGPFLGRQLALLALGCEPEIDLSLYPVTGALMPKV